MFLVYNRFEALSAAGIELILTFLVVKSGEEGGCAPSLYLSDIFSTPTTAQGTPSNSGPACKVQGRDRGRVERESREGRASRPALLVFSVLCEARTPITHAWHAHMHAYAQF